ncbi:VWA domain-containing protein [Kistimonas scapharcae]|uniref:VWA domain-containing protein n=1 Tax=Kistimonas scapharcae TaxID=1036133 RepID=A0ABP8UZI1_9GAMM
MKYNPNCVMNALPIVATSLGNKFGVKIRVCGSDAYTDGETITIPAFDPKSKKEAELVWGYLAHEAAHVRYTDWKAVPANSKSPILQHILNIIEDVRIEKEMAKPFPGTRNTITKLFEDFVLSGKMEAPKPDDHPAAILSSYLLTHLRSTVLAQACLEPLAELSRDALESCFTAGMVVRLDVLLEQVERLASTGEARDLAKRILKMIKDDLKQQAQQSNQAGQNDQSGNQGNQAGQSDQSGSQGNQAGQNDQSGSQGNQDGQNDQSGLENAIRELLSADKGALPEDFFSRIADEMISKSENAPDDLAYDYGSPKVGILPAGRNTGSDLLKKVRSESAKLSAQLHGIIQAETMSKARSASSGRRLSGPRLTRILTGDSRVFERRSEGIKPNAAVHFSLDVSGSMSNKVTSDSMVTLLDVAKECLLALSIALERIPGVNIGSSSFPGQFYEHNVNCIMPHGQSSKMAADVLTRVHTSGCTPMHYGMWHGLQQLMLQPEPRKILFIITDGEPDDPDAVHSLVKRCARSGIELVGIGIGQYASYVKTLFPVAEVVLDVTQLKKVMFNISKSLLKAA